MYIYINIYISRRAILGLRRRCAKNSTSKFDITAFRLFNMNQCEALIFSREADWGIRLDTVLCPRFHPFEIIH